MKKCARYLKGKPRQVQRYPMQERPKQLTAYSDSDFAGCLQSRKSTTCSMIFYGRHLLRGSSTTQGVIALSSGEAEFYAAVKTASLSLGMKAMMADLGVTMTTPIALRVDSTACMGAAGRRGAGKIRHIATGTLWIQRAVSEGRIALQKVLGTKNPADIGTKVLGGAVFDSIVKQSGFMNLQGTSAIALKAAV